MRNQLRKVAAAAWLWACGLFRRNAGELYLFLGLALITMALWPAVRWLSLLPTGMALVWIALPERKPFIERPPSKPRRAS